MAVERHAGGRVARLDEPFAGATSLVQSIHPGAAQLEDLGLHDLPGTGESPIAPATPDSDRIFSAALDYLATRQDVDASRIVVQGRSWSGYWAAKLAVTERARLRGAVMHGGPIHHYFEPD